MRKKFTQIQPKFGKKFTPNVRIQTKQRKFRLNLAKFHYLSTPLLDNARLAAR